MDNFIGEIKAFPYTFVPEYWFACNGQQVAIAQFQALYAVIGHNYDPDNNPNPQQYFYLPDLRGVVPIGATGPASSVGVGQTGGTESVTLNLSQAAVHNHSINTFKRTSGISALTNTPSATTYLSDGGSATVIPNLTVVTYSNATPTVNLGGQTIVPTNNPVVIPHENRMPFLPMQFGICYQGTFPPRP